MVSHTESPDSSCCASRSCCCKDVRFAQSCLTVLVVEDDMSLQIRMTYVGDGCVGLQRWCVSLGTYSA